MGGAAPPAVVGFDLDMTLVDSRAGIIACMQHALAAQGVTASQERLWPLLGAPLEANLRLLLPEDEVQPAAELYRRVYLVDAVPATTAMPGAHALLDLLRAAGSRVVVVSAKSRPAVDAVLDHVGLRPDVVAGDLFARDKASVLRDEGAQVYVGDHEGDVQAARAAGARAIAVSTGPHDEARLLAAGADEVVASLQVLVRRWSGARTDVVAPAAGGRGERGDSGRNRFLRPSSTG